MKILILNGSPRGKGLISRMLSVMAEGSPQSWRRSARSTGKQTANPSLYGMHELPQPEFLCTTRRRRAAHPSEDTMGRCTDSRLPLLLGQHERLSESIVRPHGIWHDGREFLGDATGDAQRKKSCHCQHLFHTVAV